MTVASSSLGRFAATIAVGLAVAMPAAGRDGVTDETSRPLTLQMLAAQDARVATIAYRLAVANAPLCDDATPQAGVVVQSIFQYSPPLRDAVRMEFHLDDRPAVLAVASGGPAARAGVRANDILLAIDGHDVPGEALRASTMTDEAPQTYKAVQEATSMLDAALREGATHLEVQRGVNRIEFTVSPERACAYDAQVIPSSALNAAADGRHIFIDSGFVSYAVSDDDLALILGHELAHDLLHHREELDRTGFARRLVGNLGSSRQSLLAVERQADYVGLYLTARAGYDISRAGDFWRRLARERGDPWYDHWDHPSALARARALDATRDEIEAKIRANEPLVPERARSSD